MILSDFPGEARISVRDLLQHYTAEVNIRKMNLTCNQVWFGKDKTQDFLKAQKKLMIFSIIYHQRKNFG